MIDIVRWILHWLSDAQFVRYTVSADVEVRVTAATVDVEL